MDDEVLDGLHLGTMLTIVAATLLIGVMVLWYARLYGGAFFDSAAEQNYKVTTVELDSLTLSGISDVPMASIYSVVSKEWRAVSDISIFDSVGTLITSAKAQGNSWVLSNPVRKVDGTIISKITAPEQILYTKADGMYGSRVSGRAYVVVTQIETDKTYSVQVKLQT